jgi:hypothetical protein
LSKIVLIGSVSDLIVIPDELLKNEDMKVFSFNLEVHDELQSRKIKHDIADNLLDQEARLQLFDKGLEFLSWHSKVPSNDLEFEGVNLLKIPDSHEFHSFLMPNLVNFVIIKRLIEKEKPTKIIATSLFSNMIQSIIKENSIETEFFQSKIEKKLLWDRIVVKYNIGKIPISFNLSKNNYLKIKKLVESSIGVFYDFWISHNSSKKKSIVLLEFNTEYFSNLLQQMKNYDGNVILVNRRRSAIWSKKAMNAVRKSNCKILNFDNMLTEDEKREIPLLVEKYSKKMEKFWANTELLNNIFQIENCSFWSVIKEVVIRHYSEKLSEYISLIWSVKNLFKNMDIRCIASLNEIGETEKAFLEFNATKVPTILLEHGFVERVGHTKRFDKLLYVDFKDKIAVWGDKKKEYLINEYNIAPDRIIVTGSPRHDDYFNSRIEKKRSKEITVLIAPNPITEISGLGSMNLELRFENTVKEIISTLRKLEGLKIIVKLHQIQIGHNEKIKSIIKKIDDTISIYSATPVIETINNADVVIVISSESFGTSTMLMESMILGKPTMNIVLDDNIPQFTHVKDKAILTISNNSDLTKNLQKILFDTDFQAELIKNADNFIEKFLSYRGNASERFASILKSF